MANHLFKKSKKELTNKAGIDIRPSPGIRRIKSFRSI
jgi:hypothetical protein